MLSNSQCFATLPTPDPGVLRRFYEDVLGLTAQRENALSVTYAAAGGTAFSLTQATGKPCGAHTQIVFVVQDLSAEMADLRARGVAFEEYDVPGFTTVDGVARLAVGQAAWFKDPEGNVLGLLELDA